MLLWTCCSDTGAYLSGDPWRDYGRLTELIPADCRSSFPPIIDDLRVGMVLLLAKAVPLPDLVSIGFSCKPLEGPWVMLRTILLRVIFCLWWIACDFGLTTRLLNASSYELILLSGLLFFFVWFTVDILELFIFPGSRKVDCIFMDSSLYKVFVIGSPLLVTNGVSLEMT